MAIIKCPDCGHEISNRAPACIHCGRPLDDLPKKVIRVCHTGEIVLEKEHLTQRTAEAYIHQIVSAKGYKYSFKYESGSEYRIIPDDEPIRDVKCLKRVVTQSSIHENLYVKVADRLTPYEAMQYKTQLETEQHQRLSHLAESGYYGTPITWMIVDNDAPLNYVDNSQNTITSQPSAPRCPTCGSTSIERISTAAKAAGAFTFGLFSKTAKSQFRCKRCGYKW